MPDDRIVYLGGTFLPAREARVSVDDRGFLLADGVYEVVRVAGGALLDLGAHLARLRDSLEGIRLPVPEEQLSAVPAILRTLLDRNGLGAADALVYLQVTRGVAPRRHEFPNPPVAPTLYASAAAFAPPAATRQRGVATITYPDLRWGRCDIKAIALLPNVLARQAAVERGAFEAILLREGVVTEGSASNIFGVVDGVLRTHPLGHAILPGVVRTRAVALARQVGVPVEEVPMSESELRRASELFLTSTSQDVMPIVRLDDQPVGAGAPGLVTRRLVEAWG